MSLEQLSGGKDFRRELIQKEFRHILKNARYEISENTDAIMVLSASPRGWHTKDNIQEDHPEDTARIKFSIEVYKEFVAKKLKKPIEEIATEDLKSDDLPPLVLNGATEQLHMMERIALSLGFPREKIILFNCGDHAVANTKTQFTLLAQNRSTEKFKNIVVISTSYHMPRVARTATVSLPKDVNFDVLGVPVKDFPFNVYRSVKGEVKRIINYSQKGDISAYPHRNRESL